MQSEIDRQFMKRALLLAARGLGTTSPNPAVGAVVVKEGRIVGEGYHERAGLPHAEVIAIDRAGGLTEGATLYVTLEPCCHWGRTPPCVDKIIKSGIARVVVAMVDPNPKVCGKGILALREAGIQVDVGLLNDEAMELNEGYRKHVLSGLPFVTVKYAMTLDGKIATRAGKSRWISGSESRRLVHSIRGQVDAVIVGVGTVLKDDPELSCRLWEWQNEGDGSFEPGGRCNQPVRVVVDSTCRIPVGCRVITRRLPEELVSPGSAVNRFGTHAIVATTTLAPEERKRALEAAGACVLEVGPPGADGRVRVDELLKELGRMGMVSVLVEGGPTLNAAFFRARAVDKVMAFISPMLVGGSDAPGPVAGMGVDFLEDAMRLTRIRYERIADDLLVTGYVNW